MIGFSLPKDNNSTAIQAVSPDTNVSQSISSAGQVRFAIASDSDIIRIASTASCYFKLGDSGVTATSSDILFPPGAEIFSIKARGFTHVSILGVDVTPGVASVTDMI